MHDCSLPVLVALVIRNSFFYCPIAADEGKINYIEKCALEL